MKRISTYYLFGSDACQELLNGSKESLIALINREVEDIEYSTFEFIEGVTQSRELLDAADGWLEWATISEELYNQLQ